MNKRKPIQIDEDVHQALKMYCASKGLNMKAVATMWITEKLLTEATAEVMKTIEGVD